MELPLSNVINATAEIENSASYDQIRFMMASKIASESLELTDNMPALSWARPADAASLANMSAICFLHARNVFDATGIPQVSVYCLHTIIVGKLVLLNHLHHWTFTK
jgi:hypothetical protein